MHTQKLSFKILIFHKKKPNRLFHINSFLYCILNKSPVLTLFTGPAFLWKQKLSFSLSFTGHCFVYNQRIFSLKRRKNLSLTLDVLFPITSSYFNPFIPSSAAA